MAEAEENIVQVTRAHDKLKDQILSLATNCSSTTIKALHDAISAFSQFATSLGVRIDTTDLASILLGEEEQQERAQAKIMRETYNKIYDKASDHDQEVSIQELEQRHKAVTEIYNAATPIYQKSLNENREDNENLHVLFKAIQEGRDITPKEREKIIKTPEQIANARARNKIIKSTNKIAEIEQKYHSTKLQKITDAKKLSTKPLDNTSLVSQETLHHKGVDSASKVLEQGQILNNEHIQVFHNLALVQQLAKEKGLAEIHANLKEATKQLCQTQGIAPEAVANALKIKGHKQQEFIILPPSKTEATSTSNNQQPNVGTIKHNLEQNTSIAQQGDTIKPVHTPNIDNVNPTAMRKSGKSR